MQQLLSLLEEQLSEQLEQIVLSNAKTKDGVFKVKIRPVLIGNDVLFQFTSYEGTKVYHENRDKGETKEKICSLLSECFKQMQLASANMTASVLVSKKGKVTVKCKGKKQELAAANSEDAQSRLSHNRQKQYIINEGEVVPFLVDLGVQTKEGKIVRTKYDKFRQINRFLEFLEDVVDKLPKDRTISIIDFGCGKSYLTFAMYYYLKIKRNYDIDVIGLDLKEDVIDKYEDKLGSYLVKVSALELSDKDGAETTKLLHIISDFERISDHCSNIVGAVVDFEHNDLNTHKALRNIRRSGEEFNNSFNEYSQKYQLVK